MAKPSARYVCQSCGAIAPKWAGRCKTCGEGTPLSRDAIGGR